MEKRDIILAIVVIGLLVVGITAVTKNPVTERVVERVIEKQLGGANPVFPYHYLVVGGLQTDYRSMNIAEATSTLCSFKSPAATSTLEYAAFGTDTATGTAIIVHVATGANSNATTTNIDDFSIDSGAKGIGAFASSTLIAPNQHVNFNFKGSAYSDQVFSTTDDPLGSCSVIFRIP